MSAASLRSPIDLNEDELVFDDDAPALPAPESKPAKPRKSRATKKKVEAPVEQAPEAEPEPEPASAPPPAGEVAAPAPVLVPSAPARPHPLLIATVALALLTSLFALGGLIAVGRTLAAAQADRKVAADDRAMLEKLPALVARLDAQSARLDAASQKIAASMPGGPAATVADVRHELDALKLALAGQRPQGYDALDSRVQEGFAALAAKLDRLSGGAVSASRPASRAADRGHSS